MTCADPITWDALVQYWARDLSAAEVDWIDEHVMGCETCASESARIAAVVVGLGTFIPPCVSRITVAKLAASGLHIEENTFAPSDNRGVVFRSDLDLLIHRLVGLEFSKATRVGVTIRSAGTGHVIFADGDAPFGPDGVLIACQRHYASLPADTVFEVRTTDASGAETAAVYAIPHTFEASTRRAQAEPSS